MSHHSDLGCPPTLAHSGLRATPQTPQSRLMAAPPIPQSNTQVILSEGPQQISPCRGSILGNPRQSNIMPVGPAGNISEEQEILQSETVDHDDNAFGTEDNSPHVEDSLQEMTTNQGASVPDNMQTNDDFLSAEDGNLGGDVGTSSQRISQVGPDMPEEDSQIKSNTWASRELKNLQSTNAAGWEESHGPQSNIRRSRISLPTLRLTYRGSLQRMEELLNSVPARRQALMSAEELANVKATFRELRGFATTVQPMANQMIESLQNQGAPAEAHQVQKEIASFMERIAQIRTIYDDVVSVTSSMMTPQISRPHSRAHSVDSRVS